jgi:cell volume regulation protein A
MLTEPNNILLFGGLMLLAGILAKSVSDRLGFPLLLLFLLVGMLAGEDGIGGIPFDNFETAFLASNLALAVILLDGGLRTELTTFRAALAPAGVLATIGVIITAGTVAAAAVFLLDLDWRLGLLLGAIVGSTDAAAVFNLLRQGGIALNDRVRATLEIESGANDPMAIFLVLACLALIAGSIDSSAPLSVGLLFLMQFGIGSAAGLLGGLALARLVGRMRLAEGLYALLVAAGGIVIFAAVNQIGGSGFLAVYLTGIIVGNNRGRSTEHVKLAMDGLAWLAQAGLFLILGLLVKPTQLLDYLLVALLMSAVLMFIARPLAVFLCLAPFRFPLREMSYIAWVGLRGAVPIVLAIFPVMAGINESQVLFNIAFVVVLTSLVVQGTSITRLAHWLHVLVPYRTRPLDSHELWLDSQTTVELVAFRVEQDASAVGAQPARLEKLDIPGLQLVQVVRDGRRLPLADSLFFQVDDILWLLAEPGHDDSIAAFFSRREKQGELASSHFFGEFILNGDSPAADLAASYGLTLSPEQEAASVGALIAREKGRRCVVGDRIALGPVRLTVKSMDGARISSVGLKL